MTAAGKRLVGAAKEMRYELLRRRAEQLLRDLEAMPSEGNILRTMIAFEEASVDEIREEIQHLKNRDA